MVGPTKGFFVGGLKFVCATHMALQPKVLIRGHWKNVYPFGPHLEKD